MSALILELGEVTVPRDGVRGKANTVRRFRGESDQMMLTMSETTSIDAARKIASESVATDCRIYEALEDYVNVGYRLEAVTWIQAVWMSVDDPDDFHSWYSGEHVPLLFRVPGWLRCRRYRLVTGAGPQYLAVHELTARPVATDPIGDEARSTPWRDRVMAYATEYEREMYQVL